MKRIGWSLAVVVGLIVLIYACALPGELPAEVDRPFTGSEATDDDADPLVGVYVVNGVDPTGGEYSGSVVIAQGDRPDRFDVEWIVTGGIHRGTGTRSGDVFEVEWATTAGVGDASGTARYHIAADGTLTGLRWAEGVDEPGQETIFADAVADS